MIMLTNLLGFAYMVDGICLIYCGIKGIKKQKELSRRDLLLLSSCTAVIAFSTALISITALK